MFRNAFRAALVTMLVGSVTAGYAQDAKPAETPAKPPELTVVSGRLLLDKDLPTTGGLAYFVFQRRISEIPVDGAMERAREMAEAVVAVDKEGSFSLEMAPGNYLLIYDPFPPANTDMGPGPDSQAVAQKLTKAQIDKRIELIKRTAQEGLGIVDGAIPGGFVIENRFIKPPVTEFGEMVLGDVNRLPG